MREVELASSSRPAEHRTLKWIEEKLGLLFALTLEGYTVARIAEELGTYPQVVVEWRRALGINGDRYRCSGLGAVRWTLEEKKYLLQACYENLEVERISDILGTKSPGQVFGAIIKNGLRGIELGEVIINNKGEFKEILPSTNLWAVLRQIRIGHKGLGMGSNGQTAFLVDVAPGEWIQLPIDFEIPHLEQIIPYNLEFDGIYMMFQNGRCVYIGQSREIKTRLFHYRIIKTRHANFRHLVSPKLRRAIENGEVKKAIFAIRRDKIEFERLMLEAILIKQFKPKYNTRHIPIVRSI